MSVPKLLPPWIRFAMLGVLTLSSSALGETSGDNQTHDPSRMVEANGRFYVYSTGGTSKSSADGLVWSRGPSILPNGFPSWVDTLLSSDNQGAWAPDVIFYNGQYLLYYSVCGVPAAGAPCAIGLLTSPTLDPSSSDFGWADGGMVVNNPRNSDAVQYAAIDAAPITDTTGDLWLVWGSGYGKDQARDQLYITRLDNSTGLPLASDPAYDPPTRPGYPLKTGRREGPYMHYHDGQYYLFWNEGSCCSGTDSDYTIWVSRSTDITGPFTGDQVFYASTGNINGPGHMGIYSACGEERFTYHYYPTQTSILGENQLLWADDGWPEVGPEATTPLTPCGTEGTGGIPGIGGASTTGGATGEAGAGTPGGASHAGGMLGSGGEAVSGGETGLGGASSGGTMAPSGGEAGRGGVSSGGTMARSGGSAGWGGGSAVGGAAGLEAPSSSGGDTSSGGATAVDGSGGTASAVVGSGGTSVSVSGGAPNATGEKSSSSDSGCSCSMPAGRSGSGALLLLLVAAGMGRARSQLGRPRPAGVGGRA